MQIGIEGALAPKSLSGSSTYYINRVRDFRKRTFKMLHEMHYFTDDVRITVEKDCQECGKHLDVQAIKLSYEKEHDENQSYISCIHCKSHIKPTMNVIVGRKMYDIIEPNLFHTEEEVEFYSPQMLRHKLEELLTTKQFNFSVQLQHFRTQAPEIYWNLVWHFKQFQLPYDFMLAYEQKPFMKEFEKLNSHLTVTTEGTGEQDAEEISSAERIKSSNSEQI